MKKLILIVLIGLGMTVRGWADDDDYRPNGIAPGPKGDPVQIEIWADRDNEANYYEGENITLYFRANRDCYAALYDIDTRGHVFLLYPQDPNDPHFIRGGVTYRLPDRGDDYGLWVTGPPGAEFVEAVASIRPFSLPDDWPSFYRGDRAPSGYSSSPVTVDNQNLEEFIYETNSRLIPIKQYPDECAEDLYTFYVQPRPHTVYRPVVYDYGYADFDFPYGSEIWVDGVYCGLAPIYDWGFWPGTHIVQIFEPGCPPYIRQIYVYPRSRFTVNFAFSFNFGYQNYRYYRYYYPYTYFCFLSPDYRYKYRHPYYGDSRYRDIFNRDVRFKSWVRTTSVDRDWGKSRLLSDAVREKMRGQQVDRGGDRVIRQQRENKRFTPLQEMMDRSRGGRQDRVSGQEERKSRPVYETWEQSRKGRDGSTGGDRDGVRYRGWQDGNRQRSAGDQSGQNVEGKRERPGRTWDQSGRDAGGQRERSVGGGNQPRRIEQGQRDQGRGQPGARPEGRGKQGGSRGSKKGGGD